MLLKLLGAVKPICGGDFGQSGSQPVATQSAVQKAFVLYDFHSLWELKHLRFLVVVLSYFVGAPAQVNLTGTDTFVSLRFMVRFAKVCEYAQHIVNPCC